MNRYLIALSILILSLNNIYADQKSEIYDTIIVGGGIAGMTSAYCLKDYNIKVLEKRDKVGGRAFSGEYKGFSYARGTEYLGRPEGILLKIIQELGLVIREIPYPADVHYSNGEYYYGDMGKALFLIKNSNIEEYNPVMTLGAYKRLTRLHQITSNGLYMAGDYMIYPTFEAAAVSGELAAEKVIDWLME